MINISWQSFIIYLLNPVDWYYVIPQSIEPETNPMTWQAQDHEAPKLAGMSVSELWKYTTLYARMYFII
jgi:hypothetical protein